MATLVDPTPPPAPIIEREKVYQPDAGMEFSTVEIRQVRTAAVIIEHPVGWSDEDVSTAATKRAGDLANRADWWDAETTTELVEVARGMAEMEDGEDMSEPFGLTDADLVPTPRVPVVSSDTE